MKLKSAKAFVQEVAIILIGCFLTAFAVDCILKPSGLAVTGVTGVAMVLEHWLIKLVVLLSRKTLLALPKCNQQMMHRLLVL